MQHPILYDTHAHVQFVGFADDGAAVMRRTLDNGFWMNLVGTQIDTSKKAVAWAHEYGNGVFALVGLHPTHLFSRHVDEEEMSFKSREEEFDYAVYKVLAADSKVVGIGECGLEYYRLEEYSADERARIVEKQQDAFAAQIRLAMDVKKPIAIHCRPGTVPDLNDAYDDVYALLTKHARSPSPLLPPLLVGEGGGEVWRGSAAPRTGAIATSAVEVRSSPLRGLLHCYLGTAEQAQRFLELGFYISFSGIVTFKNARALQDVARMVPLARILIETDCPYLAPEPFRGKRNEPLYVEHTARKIAELKGLSYEEVATTTTANARMLFGV